MKTLLAFFMNFLLALVFGLDILDYYFIGGLNIINSECNRLFIMWFGFIVSFISAAYFIQKTTTNGRIHN